MQLYNKVTTHSYIELMAFLSLSLVVKANVFLKDMNDFSAMNEVYTECKFLFILRESDNRSFIFVYFVWVPFDETRFTDNL